uniref:PDZ domain-containing protein n=1 Tax=Oryzias sinensis TaxID=183150 RepID=A0A8C7YE05_9TELE
MSSLAHPLILFASPASKAALFLSLRCDIVAAHLLALTRTVEFPGDRGALGIHVIPYCSSLSGRTLGLHIKGIEENSRSRREKLFKEEECIVQINDTPLLDKTFAQSQEVFRQAMMSPSVCLEVLPAANKPRYEKNLIGQLFSDGKESPSKTWSPGTSRAQPDPKQDPKLKNKPQVHSADRGSPTPPSPSPTRSQSPPDPRSPTAPADLTNMTARKGGKKIRVDLKKGTEGLGFTVVTRDSSVHGPGPILVKNILARGAAIKDGRLQPGDRILEVNGVNMMERSQEELVAMLRSTKQGESVRLLVARQDDLLPRELKGEEASRQVMEDGREQLMYEIPLNETGSAGLGVSLKGNKSKETGEDLGIFIKSIIHGGAAQKDGRLSVNDQLIAVNGETLVGRSNHAAMETLRRSMSSEGNARGTIQLVVLRSARQVLLSASSSTPASTDDNHSHYGNEDGEGGFPPPPSPSTVEQMNRDLTLAAQHHRKVIPHKYVSAGEAFGPTLGLQKSSSLESLLTAMSEQSHAQVPVPFHRPRPNIARARGCNQSFRNAIDRSYEGPSEDDDDGSDQSSGHETPASSSSRQDLDADEGKKKKKTKGKKKEKKNKGKKKAEDSGDELEKKPKKKGFGILRLEVLLLIFHIKNVLIKNAALAVKTVSKSKLDALSEEELDQRDGYEHSDPRYGDARSGYITPDRGSLPDYDDDDSDPNYARVNNFRQAPSPLFQPSRTPSPAMPAGRSGQLHPAAEELDGLYAKVNKSRPPAASQNKQQGPHREHPQARAAPGYEELEAARRRVLDHDPQRVICCVFSRRDPYDYPTSRPVAREPGPYSAQQVQGQQRYYPSTQQHAQLRQDVPPSPTGGRGGRYYSEPARGRADGYRQASPDGYKDDRQPDPRRKNAMIAPV